MNTFAVGTSWESLLVILGLFLVSAISNWLKQKREGHQPDPPPNVSSQPGQPRSSRRDAPLPPLLSRPGPQRKRASWEEELRRLVEEQIDRPRGSMEPPVPPRTMTVPEPRPVAAPEPLPRMPERVEKTLQEESLVFEYARGKPEPTRLPESSQAYQTAQRLPEEIAGRLRQADRRVERHTHSIPRAARAESTQALEMVRHPTLARQAFIASLIFGPPKALEQA